MNCLCYDEKYSGETRLIKQTRTRETDLFAATAILSTLRFPILLRSLPFFLSFLPPFFVSFSFFLCIFAQRPAEDGPRTEYEQGKEEEKGRNFYRKACTTHDTGYVLFRSPLQSTPGIIRHFLQAASHSTDIKIQLLLEKKGRIPNGVSPIWSGQRLDDFQVEEEEDFASLLTTFFFLFLQFFFPPNNFAKTETIANCGSLLLIFPMNFVSRASFVFVSRVNSSPR